MYLIIDFLCVTKSEQLFDVSTIRTVEIINDSHWQARKPSEQSSVVLLAYVIDHAVFTVYWRGCLKRDFKILKLHSKIYFVDASDNIDINKMLIIAAAIRN